MIRIYTFTIIPPSHIDPMVAGPLMTKQLDRMAAASKELLEATVEVTDERQIRLTMLYQARDAWYIHKRIKFPLVAALRKANLRIEHVKTTQISAPVSGRDRPTPRVPPPIPSDPRGSWSPVTSSSSSPE